MTLVLLVVFLAVVVVSSVKDERSYSSVGWSISSIIGWIFAIITFIVAIGLVIDIASAKVIPEKIAMYEAENQKIEESIDLTVQKYLGYEAETYEKMRGDGGSVAIVTAYPELASSTLVEKQIETYVNNNDKIKKLKGDQIDLSWKRWWLYFGS